MPADVRILVDERLHGVRDDEGRVRVDAQQDLGGAQLSRQVLAFEGCGQGRPRLRTDAHEGEGRLGLDLRIVAHQGLDEGGNGRFGIGAHRAQRGDGA